MCNFFFCHYVFKKPSAAEASESVYMRERVNPFSYTTRLQQLTLKSMKNFINDCQTVHVLLLNIVESVVAKREIACFEQFLLLSQCYLKSSAAEALECVYKWVSLT